MNKVSEKTGATLLLQCLLMQGAKLGFGVPGESYLALLDAFYDSNQFRFVGTRHEAGAAYMAEAYGKLTGEVGLCFVSRGPGACHAAIAIHTAKQNSTPMVAFVGQVETSMRHREAFQEIDYEKAFAPMVKLAIEIDDVNRIPELIYRAFAVAQSGRPGPVVVALPENILTQKSNVEVCKKIAVPKIAVDANKGKEIMALLSQAKKPVVLVGGAGWNKQAKADFKKFVENNNLPVVVAFRNQDILDNNSPSYCGEASFGMPKFVSDIIQASDLLLAINVRFGEVITDGYKLLDPKNFNKVLIHCHVGIDELAKIFSPNIAICACVESVCEMLSACTPVSTQFKSHTESLHKIWLDSLDAPKQPGELDMGEVMKFLRDELPKDSIITNGAGNFSMWPGRHLLYSEGMRLLAPQSGAMGYGIPAAVMAKIVAPERFVLCFAGDGDFQMSLMELGTALQQKIGFVILLINNRMYGTIRLHQERAYPKRVSGTDIVNPDFVAIAKGYGMFAARITKTAEFADAFSQACQSASGGLLELVVDNDALSPHIRLSELQKETN